MRITKKGGGWEWRINPLWTNVFFAEKTPTKRCTNQSITALVTLKELGKFV